MTIDLKTENLPLDPEDKKYSQMLNNLQGNILKSHGRNFSLHLFLTFGNNPLKVKQWIAAFTQNYVTSAYRQHYDSNYLKKDIENIFGGIYLSAAGYHALGFVGLDDLEEDNSIENNVWISFKDGMAAGFDELSDIPPGEWDEPFQNNQIHALVLLAADDKVLLEKNGEQIKQSLQNVAIKVFVQKGEVLRENGKPIEHFGFRDCISQPLFYQQDIEKEREKGFDRWDSAAALQLVLIKDALTNAENAFGSYLVYRKLEQNVKEFKEAERRLAGADNLNLSENERERAGALIVGRYRNGVPVELSATDDAENLIDYNNFNFLGADDKPTVTKCPYHAHIRRMMPRGELGLENGKFKEEEMRHRIVRRGITYDDREKDANGKPLTAGDAETDVGLLFMCFQSSIPKQFGFLQARWANATGFLGKDEVGIDPIIGQNLDLQDFEHQKWHPKWGDETETPKSFEFKTFVTLKGGEYFFAPSIPFLLSLGK